MASIEYGGGAGVAASTSANRNAFIGCPGYSTPLAGAAVEGLLQRGQPEVRMPREGSKRSGRREPESLPAWDESGALRVLVDTPRGSAVKYKRDTEKAVYR